MSFLKGLIPGMGGGTEAAAGAAPALANPMANGLGSVLGTSGSNVSSIADRIGMGANQIAQAGGAEAGYAPPPVGMAKHPSTGDMPADPNNHLQLLDPAVLHALVQKFSSPARGQNQMEQY